MVVAQFQPSISAAPGQSVVMRLVHTAGDSFIQLRAPSPAGSCTLTQIASDGVFLSTPIDKSTNGWVMMNAGRAEIVVSCSTAGSYAFVGQFGDNT
jgi:hypothetical protein